MANQYIRNIPRLYVIKIAKWFSLVMPIIVLFYQDNDMGMHEIFLLKAIYSIAVVIMEIPSGWMADAWGRKKTLFLGSILGAAGFMIYSFSYGFWAFAIAEIVLGIGNSFVSGADSAMLFDSLKAANKTDNYTREEGRITSIGNFAEAIAGVLGGFLAAISLRTPFYFQFLVAASAIPAAIMLKEPGLSISTQNQNIKSLVKNIRKGLRKSADLRISIYLSAITGTATLIFAWLVQPFFKNIGFEVEAFGILWTALNLSVGISSMYAYKVERKLGRKASVLLIILLLATGYLLSGIWVTIGGLSFLFLFYLVRGLATPILKNYINLYTDSEVRATMLSVRNFIIRIAFIIVGPLLGWTTDNLSLNAAFILAGGIYIVSALLVSYKWIGTRQK